ncbi:MAG: ribonucleoside triphosphate reductase, partial [Patescibacteria group bacterium]
QELDWQVKENANMAYSLQGLNEYVKSAVTKKYWLDKIYPKEIREAYLSGDMHIHNLDSLATYCCGWDLYDLLIKGFRGVFGKVESKPAKHFRTALGQVVNFFYTLQGETAGAVAFSSFDTLLAPFIRYDNLSYLQVKQAMQEFIFNMAIPTRVGFQTPFTNVTLDIKPLLTLTKQPVIIGGQPQKETYGEFQEEMNVFNRAFYEVLMEGDAKGRPFTFPIPTINITKDFEWENPNLNSMWEATAKYGVNYFSNFINSDMKPEDVRSMCCRLRLDNKELYLRGGGLFGSNPLTGSIGVVTANLPRIGYLSKTKKEFFARLTKVMDLAKESLEIKRKTLENFMEKGLYPYSKFYLGGIKQMRNHYYSNHFSTIGLVGMNEALLNFMEANISSKKGRSFAIEVLDFMRSKLVNYQKETGNLYNLEATPAEGVTYRLPHKDKELYPNIITAGQKEPYYTNSSQLPVNFTTDVFEALKLQDEIQRKYTGGTVLHMFLGERISDIQTIKNLIKKTFETFRLPYVTITPTFSICPTHGYLSGEHFLCPECTISQPCEVYSRIVGYIRPIQQWHASKREEFRQRKEFKIPKLAEAVK